MLDCNPKKVVEKFSAKMCSGEFF